MTTLSASANALDSHDSLKRCSPWTRRAVRVFRQTGNPRYLPSIVRGVLEGFVPEGALCRTGITREDLRLAEDLGIDSLGLMEFAIAIEDAVGFRVEAEELKHLCTVGDVERYLEAISLVRSPVRSQAHP